jgi:hypothetical protein
MLKNRFYILFKFSEQTEGKTRVIKYYLLQNFIKFECPGVQGRELERADIRLHNNGAVNTRLHSRGTHL